MLHVSIQKNTLLLTGTLTETATFSEFKNACLTGGVLQDEGMGGVSVRVDFSGVTRANSVGLLHFSQFLQQEQNELPPLRFVNTPEFLMEIFGLTTGLLRAQDWIESIRVPFFNSERGQRIYCVLRVGEEIPMLDSYRNFHLEFEIEGQFFVLDTLPEGFFKALTLQKALQQARTSRAV